VRSVLVCLLITSLAACRDGAPERPNVLLISIDSLRHDHLGCYGYGRATSPNLDRLAAEGAVFEQHVSSSSWTLPAHAALFTALPDSGHGCTDVDRALSPRHQTVAEQFQAGGYATAGFFAGPFLHPGFGLGQGFDIYQDCTSNAAALAAKPASEWGRDSATNRLSHKDVANPRTFDAFQAWLARRDERPFFAFVHLWDVHYDFTPPPPWDERFDPGYQGWVTGEDFFFDERIGPRMEERDLEHLIALYDGEIGWTDTFLAKIRDELERAGVLDDTVIVVTADHGTEFFEHGWKGHRTTLYDEVIRVPLVVRYPRHVPGGVRVAAQTRSIDIAPMLLEICGLPALTDVAGESLLPLLRDPARRAARGARALSELDSVGRSLLSVRDTEWKVIGDRAAATARVFDLRADPGEHAPIPEPTAPFVQEGVRALDVAGTELLRLGARNAGDVHPSTPPEEVLRQMRGLGYTGQTPAPPQDPAPPPRKDQ
jgi:arylsulfatase A-like enzyme